MLTRREFIRNSLAASGTAYLAGQFRLLRYAIAAPQQGSLDPLDIDKFVTPLIKPPAMPHAGQFTTLSGEFVETYEIAVRQFQQQILPPSLQPTTVWSYGAAAYPQTFNYPSFTIEARVNSPVQVTWINDLVGDNGNYLPHLLPVDPTLHWANPPGPRDTHGMGPDPYEGPVPIVTHVHGAHTQEWSDGYPEAWYLPDAANIPAGYYRTGTFYDYYKAKHNLNWAPGTATFVYPNDQRAATSWYHDHTLGITRLNVYAGPAGFYLIRGPFDTLRDKNTGSAAILPGPPPPRWTEDNPPDPLGTYYEIPLAIQDRSFNDDGSLFYPDNRAYFEGLNVPGETEQFPGEGVLDIPFQFDAACTGPSDIAPMWNPEFFGNTIVVNGRTWPYLDVEKRRYRFRLLNGCNSRFLILDFSEIASVEVWQIGSDGGFLPDPVNITADHDNRILLGPAERADVIVDFTAVPQGDYVLKNLGPDEPFGGGEPGVDFEPADPATTGQIMQFSVAAGDVDDPSTPPADLQMPAIPALDPTVIRPLSLNEEDSRTVFVREEEDGSIVVDCDSGEPFGPAEATLGTVVEDDRVTSLSWDKPLTDNPDLNATEMWELYNFTADAHPIHLHLIHFQVVNRQPLQVDEEGVATKPPQLDGDTRPPDAGEEGWKDTVIAYPGEVTRIRAKFDVEGLFVWHCHILEHEDNEMMRPYHIGPIPLDSPLAQRIYMPIIHK
jgi:spore coat protein A, manganese oxidase